MSVIHVSYSDLGGGAARAAYRLHRALFDSGYESRMKVRNKESDDWTVEGPNTKSGNIISTLRALAGGTVMRLQRGDNVSVRSGNWFPSRWADTLTAAADVVHLHWVAGETMSIEDLGRIRSPVVWTLHDMWPFCGTEHYSEEGELARWRTGYSKFNRGTQDGGIDLERIVWKRKLRAWKTPWQIVVPSIWMAGCVRNSELFHDWPVTVIPNALNTDVYQPLERSMCRKAIGIDSEKTMLLFGAIGGSNDPRKGYDILLAAIRRMANTIDNPDKYICVICGQSKPKTPPHLPFETLWIGHVHDDVTLALVYGAADVTIVPSRQEAFGQAASEAMACGCPVVAFRGTGLADVVEHSATGYLAEAGSVEDLAHGIQWVLAENKRSSRLRIDARSRAVRLWRRESVVQKYRDIYQVATEQVNMQSSG